MAGGEDLARDMAFRPTSDEQISILRGLRAGANIPFVHRSDVCSDAPADPVGSLAPAPCTREGDSVWYFFGANKYASARAKPGGKRQRAVGGGKACWHAEAGPKKVQGLGGGSPVGVFRTFSYGCKTAAKFERLGWCLAEYALDDKQDGYVLFKVYRSPRAKGESASSTAAQPSSGTKRKAAGGDHPESRPAKSSRETLPTHGAPTTTTHGQVQHVAEQGFYGYEIGVKQPQPHAEPEPGGEFAQTVAYGSLESDVAGISFLELLGGLPTASSTLPDEHFFDDLPFPF